LGSAIGKAHFHAKSPNDMNILFLFGFFFVAYQKSFEWLGSLGQNGRQEKHDS
jgi:hypothetical protein